MRKGVKKGTRMVYWSVQLGLRGFKWVDPSRVWVGDDRGFYMTKHELKRFLKNFKTSDFPRFDIISVKMMRTKRIGTTTMWTSETMGYTDVTPQGTLYDINI